MYSLTQLLSNTKNKNLGTLVLAGGSYDLLHIGHLRFLEKAKEKGDVLIVGVDSDSLIKSKKPETRPYIPEKQRAEMVHALKPVDYVFITNRILYDSYNLKKIKPNILVFAAEKKRMTARKRNAQKISAAFPSIKICFISSGVRGVISTTKIESKIIRSYQ